MCFWSTWGPRVPQAFVSASRVNGPFARPSCGYAGTLRTLVAYVGAPRALSQGGGVLGFVACSGACVYDVRDERLSALRGDTTVVTISVGGNDSST